jgi:hypothetical protein
VTKVSEARCQHGLVICSKCVVITDAARRMSDAINARITFGSWEIRNCWMAFRLQDGSTDGNLYDTKADAIRHVSNYKYWAFFCFRNAMQGAKPFDCQIFLDLHRHAYENGGQLTDPDARHPNNPRIMTGGSDLIIPTRQYDGFTGKKRLEIPLGRRVRGRG